MDLLAQPEPALVAVDQVRDTFPIPALFQRPQKLHQSEFAVVGKAEVGAASSP